MRVSETLDEIEKERDLERVREKSSKSEQEIMLE